MLRAAREACDEHGALLIFDEIQCGMGRTGDLWAWQGVGVRPDVMTVGQGAGRRAAHRRLRDGAAEFADVLQPGDHGSTFAGGPVVAAAANAVLDVVDDAGLPRLGGRAKGERLRRRAARARPARCAAAG